MRQEIKTDTTIKRCIKSNGDGIADVELSTGQIGTVKWDFVNSRPVDLHVEIAYDKQKVGR